MRYEMKESRFKGEWVVEAINAEGDGEIYVAAFSGPDAKVRAAEYVTWKQITLVPPSCTGGAGTQERLASLLVAAPLTKNDIERGQEIARKYGLTA